MARILLLDDEEPLRRLMAELLEEEGHSVSEGGDGRLTEDAERLADFDLVITDLMMPDADGLDVLRNIRACRPEMKVLAVSGGGRTVSQNFLPVAKVMGAQATLSKPFRPQELIDAVEALLKA